jgi:hypothetical protein
VAGDPKANLMPRTLSPAMTFGLFAGLAGFALAAFSPGLLNDGDTYWHIRAGEWMLAHHAVLRADVFSYTMMGAPWHTQEWLAEIIMALTWPLRGWAGIHLLFALCTGLTAAVVGFHVRKRVDMIPALLTVVLGLCCVTISLLARPHMLALPLLAIWTAGLAAARERNQAPSWWLLPLIPLWANLHGSFAFGLALATALAVEAVAEATDRRKAVVGWGLFLLAATLSVMATPFGFHTLMFPFQLSGMEGLAHIGEWQASDFSHPTPLAFALLTALFVLGSGKVKVPPLRMLLLVGLAWLALSHMRHQMLLGVTAPILLASALAKSWPAQEESSPRLFGIVAAILLMAMMGTRLALPVVRHDGPVTPASALAHVPQALRQTPVLNGYGFGGYLIWEDVKVYIDSRADLYGDVFLKNYAGIISPDRDALTAAIASHHVQWTIFPTDAPVTRLIDTMPGWKRLYSDKLATVHVRD